MEKHHLFYMFSAYFSSCPHTVRRTQSLLHEKLLKQIRRFHSLMYGCHVLPVPLPAAIADNLSDHRVPAVSMEPISQSHAIQRASVPSWIWHLEWFTIPGFICTKWGPKFVLNFECISGSCVSGWQIVACLAGFVFFVSFSLSFLFFIFL